MNRIETIIDALEKAKDGWECFDECEQALAAARELKADALKVIEAQSNQSNQFYPDWDMLKPYHDRIAELEAELAKREQELPSLRQVVIESALKGYGKSEQEPVCDKDPFYCWSIRCQLGKKCKHPAPPRKEWVGLTDEEILECQKPGLSDDVYKLIEAKLRIKNER